MTDTQKNCSNCENKTACIPFFQHENAMTHKDRDNRRMMVICLALCVVVICLVAYYTSRTQMWNDTIVKLTATLAEVKNGAPGP